MAAEEVIGKEPTGGMVIGRAATSLLSFYGATPVDQPAPAVAVGTDLATVILELADLRASLVELGLIAA